MGPTRLVYTGRLSPEKNPGAVIEAVRLLVRDGVDVRLDVLGTGGALVNPRRAAVGLPMVFHGYVSDRSELARRLADADVALAPSAAETFGLSVLEALACGTPVVTSDTGGAGELLARGAGVAVPATPVGIAAGVAEVLTWQVSARRAAARAGRTFSLVGHCRFDAEPARVRGRRPRRWHRENEVSSSCPHSWKPPISRRRGARNC
jgi:alpha-1,6-mannosyltransferase